MFTDAKVLVTTRHQMKQNKDEAEKGIQKKYVKQEYILLQSQYI